MITPKRVALILADWPSYELYCPNFSGMQDGLREMGIEYKLISCRPELNVQDVIDYKPDLIVYGLLDMVKNKIWRNKIRQELPDAKIIMWYGDLRDSMTGQVDADMSEIDMMFVSNNAQNEFYERKWKVKKCQFMPLGCSIYTPNYRSELDFPFVFVGAKITGSWFINRAKNIIDLERNGLKVVNAPADRETTLRSEIMRQIPDLYFSSKIVLDISHFTDINGYTSNRFWVIPASGGFALTKRWPGCEEFYPEGTRVYFDTTEECIEKKNYYLSHDDEREKIRKASYEQAKLHTYPYRWRKIFDLLYT